MDQGPNIRRVATGTMQQHGSGAFAYIREQANIAKLNGDFDSAVTWWDIALAIVEIQSETNRGNPLSFP